MRIALVAASRTCPGGAVHQIARMADLPASKFDAIVSNPPIH